jgi:hypothetical protein
LKPNKDINWHVANFMKINPEVYFVSFPGLCNDLQQVFEHYKFVKPEVVKDLTGVTLNNCLQ